MIELQQGDISQIDTFQRRRQGLIQAMEKIEVEAKQHTASESMRSAVDTLCIEKNDLVRRILDLDQMIMTQIDRIKDDTIQKLQSLQSGRKTIGAYKSPLESIEQAENKKLDQEA